jgi:hypothetical protein
LVARDRPALIVTMANTAIIMVKNFMLFYSL